MQQVRAGGAAGPGTWGVAGSGQRDMEQRQQGRQKQR